MNVLELFATIAIKDAGYRQGMKDAEEQADDSSGKINNSLLKIGTAVAAGVTAGATAAVSLVNSVGAAGDSIDKMSQKLGISSQAYQEWSFILEHSGASVDSLQTTMKTLSNAAQDASDDQVAAFEKIGLSMEDVKNMSTEDLFSAVITGLQGMEEGTDRTATASDLLGRAATELGPLLNTSAEDTAAMKDQVNELGGVMSDSAVKDSAAYEDALFNVQTALTGVKNKVGTDLMPTVTNMLDKISTFISTNDIPAKIESIIGKLQTAAPILIGIGSALGIVSAAITAYNTVQTVSEAITAAKIALDLAEETSLWGVATAQLAVLAPYIAIAAAIAAVIAIGILLYKNWDKIAATASNMVKQLKMRFGELKHDVTQKFTQIKTEITSKVSGAVSKAVSLFNSLKSKVSSVVSGIYSKVKSTFERVKTAITHPIQTAKDTVKRVFDTIKSIFSTVLKINLKVPHISVSGGKAPWGIGGKGTKPSFSVKWNAKAVNNPYMFSGATLFGAGETTDEILYGRQNLLNDIKEASGGGTTNNITTNIYASGADDPEEWGRKCAAELRRQVSMA